MEKYRRNQPQYGLSEKDRNILGDEEMECLLKVEWPHLKKLYLSCSSKTQTTIKYK